MNPHSVRPPLVARLLVTLCLRGEMREVVRGDLDQEFHDALAAGGTRRAAARRYWRQSIGSIAAARAAARDHRLTSGDTGMAVLSPANFTSGLGSDLRHVIRRLAASPGFTAVAILSLAIGIGANTAIASIARAVLIDSMPVDQPEQLGVLYWAKDFEFSSFNSSGYTDPATGQSYSSNFSYPAYEQLRASAPPGVETAAFTFIRQAYLAFNNRPTVAGGGLLVSGSYFSTMRPRIVLGRGLTDDDDRPGAAPAVVLSYAFWQKAFAGSARALDTPVTVNGIAARVVGVTGPGFRGPSPGGFFPQADITLTLAMQPTLIPQWNRDGVSFFTSDRHDWLRVIMRHPEGMTRSSLHPFLDTQLRAYVRGAGLTDAAGVAGIHSLLVDGARGLGASGRSGAALRQSLTMIAAIVAIVLLITCLNLASLMLARGVATSRESAVRRALGASRWRLVRLTLSESLVLAFAGAAVGLAIAAAGRKALAVMMVSLVGPTASELPLDRGLLLTTLGITLAAALVAGLLPSLRLSSGSAANSLNDRPGGSTAPRLLIGRVMLALQVGVSIPLLAGAGLLLRTVQNLNTVDLGFSPDSVAIFNVDASVLKSARPDPPHIYEAILARLRTMDGVVAASMCENPLVGGIQSNNNITFAGAPSDGVSLMMNAIGPDFFETMGIPILQGRSLRAEDFAGPNAVVVNETAARDVFHGSAVGRHFTINDGKIDFEIVGVVADTKYDSLRNRTRPTFYDYHSHRAGGTYAGLNFVVRTSGSPAAYEGRFRDAVNAVNTNLALTKFTTQTDQIHASVAQERAFTLLLTIFGAFALLLASVGLHGVTSYAVARRTSEIGIRIALGAQRGQVLWLIMRQVLVLAAIGLAVGLPAAIAAGPALTAMLFELTPTDPVTMTAAGVTMLAVTMLAGWLPARRAARLDPLTAIRRE